MLAALAMSLAVADPPALPEGPALTEAVRARDAEFFALAFLGCDPERLRTMLTADFRNVSRPRRRRYPLGRRLRRRL
jgi:hypothetical protein